MHGNRAALNWFICAAAMMACGARSELLPAGDLSNTDASATGTEGSGCAADTDCIYCAYPFAPTSETQCYCSNRCELDARTRRECDLNVIAWTKYCANQNRTCLLPLLPTCAVPPPIRCINGVCRKQVASGGA